MKRSQKRTIIVKKLWRRAGQEKSLKSWARDNREDTLVLAWLAAKRIS